jgi:hypothetical protein
MDQTTRLDLQLQASISDSNGLKDTPLLYYSSTDPGPNPDLSQMTQVSASLTSGDQTNGTWNATVPNPVASMNDGATATVYYIFAADDFDSTNNCNHVSQSQTYSMTVTAGGSSTAGLCQPCSADSQCGAGNECAYMGNMNASYCLQACGSGCPSGYTCSASTIISVDLAAAQQCVPQSGSCEMPAGQCQNDAWDPNQTQSEASANGPFPLGLTSGLINCPAPNSTTRGEDDWFKIVIPQAGLVNIYLSGDGSADLDLHLYHSDGTVVDKSTGHTDQEMTQDCLQALTYYVKVNSFTYARDVYSLEIDLTPGGC